MGGGEGKYGGTLRYRVGGAMAARHGAAALTSSSGMSLGGSGS